MLIPKALRLGAALLGIAAIFPLVGCVSSTLESAKSEPATSQTHELALTQDQRDEAMIRQKAIDEIHAKAKNHANDSTAQELLAERTNQTSVFTGNQTVEKTREIQQLNAQANQLVTDAELQEKQRSMARMRNLAGHHFDNALKSIEKNQ